MSRNEALELIERDRNETDPHGQATREAFHLADVFVRTANAEYQQQLTRFLDLLFGYPFHTPTQEEHGMFIAFAAALRSADLSRQVGSAVVSAGGEIVGAGCNDVPKAGGGLYGPEGKDQRDYVRGEDTNEIRRNELIREIVSVLFPKNTAKRRLNQAIRRLKNTGIMDLTEYGRATHAEMDALLAAARVGVSVRGATLYTTTFPCHNCTRHIIGAGIRRVVYIEPYPKSRAEELHSDAITITEQEQNPTANDDGDRVSFDSFVGVGPRRYTDLFAITLSSGKKIVRKENGRRITWTPNGARPRVPMLPSSYLEREEVASNELERAMRNKK